MCRKPVLKTVTLKKFIFYLEGINTQQRIKIEYYVIIIKKTLISSMEKRNYENRPDEI